MRFSLESVQWSLPCVCSMAILDAHVIPQVLDLQHLSNYDIEACHRNASSFYHEDALSGCQLRTSAKRDGSMIKSYKGGGSDLLIPSLNKTPPCSNESPPKATNLPVQVPGRQLG